MYMYVHVKESKHIFSHFVFVNSDLVTLSSM